MQRNTYEAQSDSIGTANKAGLSYGVLCPHTQFQFG